MSTPEAFDLLRSALERAGVRYAVGGSWASTAFGEPRFSIGVDILADLTQASLPLLFRELPPAFYADAGEARSALDFGRAFNVIHMPSALKFDLFPAASFPLGLEELERAVSIDNTGLSAGPVLFVTPEDVLLAKLHWYRLGAQVSELQWRDIQGIVRTRAGALDREYLERGASRLGLLHLLNKALALV